MPVWRLRDFADDDLDQAIQVWDQSRVPVPTNRVSGRRGGGRGPRRPARGGGRARRRDRRHGRGPDPGRPRLGDARGAGRRLASARDRQRPAGRPGTSAAHARGCGASARSSARARPRCRPSIPPATPGATGLVYYHLLEHPRPDQADVLADLGGHVLPAGLWARPRGDDTEKKDHRAPRRRAARPPRGRRAPRRRSRRARSCSSGRPAPARRRSRGRSRAGSAGRSSRCCRARCSPTPAGPAAALRDRVRPISPPRAVLVSSSTRSRRSPPSAPATVDRPMHGLTNELLKLVPALPPARPAAARLRHQRPALRSTRRSPVPAASTTSSPSARPTRRAGRDLDELPRRRPTRRRGPAGRRLVAVHARRDRESGCTQGRTRRRSNQRSRRAPPTVPPPQDYLAAIGEVRPTLTAAMLTEFASDSEQFARL